MARSTVSKVVGTSISTAALAGLLAGSVVLMTGCSDSSSGTKSAASAGEKHACKGQNACKGQGGCKTDAHSCKGQNACKSMGGCKAG